MSDQQINVHVQSGTGEILRIVATLLLFGGAGAIAWSVAQGAYKEQAATGMSMMIVMMVKLMISRGMLRIPDTGGADQFKESRDLASKAVREWTGWQSRMSMPAMALTAIGYAVSFLILRGGVAAALGVFQNLYIAGGCAAMLGALVVFPSLVPNMIAGLKSRGVVAVPAPATQPVRASRIEPQVIAAPAPRTQAAPSSPAASGATSTQPVQQRVVRRVVKKESTNE